MTKKPLRVIKPHFTVSIEFHLRLVIQIELSEYAKSKGDRTTEQ